MDKNGFILIGHLQVIDEPMSSLYCDKLTNRYYLVVRTDDNTYVMSPVELDEVLAYMNKQRGIRSFFIQGEKFEFIHTEGSFLSTRTIQPISTNIASRRLNEDGVIDGFVDEFAYKSVALRHYISKTVSI